MSVLDFVEQAKGFTLEERSEIIRALQQQLFEARGGVTVSETQGPFEIWSPTADESTINTIRKRIQQRSA
jgi:hypothetical protein